jgi:hypothetical protein
MHTPGQRKCRHCSQFFVPDPRNRYHQRYCGRAACRQASKRVSQGKWESRPENRDYNRSAEKAVKVKAWQAAHPGYWKRRRSQKAVLPEVLPVEVTSAQADGRQDGGGVLPDLWHGQPPVVIGLIAQMTGCVLPEDIAAVTGRLIVRGQALMGSLA